MLGLVLVLLAVGPEGATPASSPASPGVVAQSLRDLVAQQGRARVIVELELPGVSLVPEGFLPSFGAVFAQRREIAAVQQRILSRLQLAPHQALRRYRSVPYLALEVDDRGLRELEASSFHVKRIFEDVPVPLMLSQSAPLIEASQAWALGHDGTGTVVAILDTGVQASHPFFGGRVVQEACFSSTVSGQSTTVCPNGSEEQTGPGSAAPCPMSGCSHGTHVAGIAAGNGAGAGQSFSGIAKGAQIMAVQVFSRFTGYSSCGFSSPCAAAWTSDIIAGLDHVHEVRSSRNIVAANLSLGSGSFSSPCDTQPYKPMIDNLRSLGVATVIASGNGSSSTSLASPACISSAISVGSTTKSDAVSSFSSVTSFLSLFAPGQSITSSLLNGSYGVLSGTSMAAPHVTGAWAVLKHASPDATVAEILGALQQTGVPITDSRNGVTKSRVRIAQALANLDSDAPVVSAVSPNEVAPGTSPSLAVSGSRFVAGATVTFGAGISVNQVTFNSANLLTVSVTVAPEAALGSRTVVVTNPGGSAGQLPNGLTVKIAGEIIIDNGQPGTSSTGLWCTSAGAAPFGGGSLYSCGTNLLDTYRWTPPIPARTTYDVFVWWTVGTNRGTAVPYRVRDASGSITTKTFNERVGGGNWVLHGRYTFDGGTSGYIETDDSAGQAAADAVKLLPVAVPPPDPIAPDTTITAGPPDPIDQNSASFTWTGSDNVPGTLLFASMLEPLETSFTGFTSATGRTFSNLTNRTYKLHVKAKDGAGNEDPTPDTWTFRVDVASPPASEIIIDNGAVGTTFTGSWCVSAGSNPFGSGSLYSCGTGTVDTYRWRPTIPAPRAYDVYVWWTTGASRAVSAPFTVVHAGGSTTRNFNERTGGGQWVLHGRYTFNAGTPGYIQTSDASGQACADAVRLVPVP